MVISNIKIFISNYKQKIIKYISGSTIKLLEVRVGNESTEIPRVFTIIFLPK